MAEIQQMTGFQSACAEYAEDRLSLDERYLTNPPAMFPLRVSSDSRLFELRKDDELIIDRSLDPKSGDLVVAIISNEFVIARFSLNQGVAWLLPFNKKVGEDELGEDYVWGVISSQHRKVRK
ncbi:MAG TPA: S24 family peptidase [Bacteriovoracaceae bacterium]|nr:S24 family peptidase [Bacteriovoracaceae bacterium]